MPLAEHEPAQPISTPERVPPASEWTVEFKADKAVWDAFVATSPQRSIFVTSRFLDSLLVDYDLVICADKRRIVAGVVIIRSPGGAPREAVHGFTSYQGLLLADSGAQQVGSRTTHEFKVTEYFAGRLVEHYRGCCLCHSWRLQDLRPFQWYNYHEPAKGMFKLDLRYSALIDLQKYDSFDAYLSSIRTVRRQEYRKSEKLLTWGFCTDETILDALYEKTLARQGIVRTALHSSLVRSIARQAFAGNYGKMICVKLGDVPVAAALFMYDDRTAFYLFGANDPAHRNTFGGTLALLEMIKHTLEERRVMEIDLVGVNSPSRGDYKIGFNPELRPYFITTFNAVQPVPPA